MGATAVSSYIELYLTAFGWSLYDAFWNVLVVSGLAWWPFIYAIYKNTREPAESQEPRSAPVTSLRRMQWSMLVMIFVVAFAVTPAISVNMNAMSYHCPSGSVVDEGMPCTLSAGATIGNTGTSMDGLATGLPMTAKVPVLWAALASITGGVINASIQALPAAADFRSMQQMLQASRLQDPRLVAEVQQFNRDCYAPALQKLKSMSRSGSPIADQIQANLKADGDLSWIGNQALVSTPGLYAMCPNPDVCGDTLRASTPVEGWTVNASRDTEDIYQNSASAPGGRPYCNEWWQGNGADVGLRQRLVAEGARTMIGQTEALSYSEPMAAAQNALALATNMVLKTAVNSWVRTHGDTPFSMSSTQAEDLIAQKAFTATPAAGLIQTDRTYGDGGLGSSAKTVFQSPFQLGALKIAQFTQWFSMPLVRQSAPVIQSAMLMLLLAALPFLMVFGRYEVDSLIMCAVGYVTIRFWSVLWAVVDWVDSMLTMISNTPADAATSGIGGVASGLWAKSLLTSAFDGTSATATLISLIVMGLYVLVPGIFSVFMGWAGFHGMAALSSVGQSMTRFAERAGQQAASNAIQTVGTALSAPAGGVGGAVGGAAGAKVASGAVRSIARSASSQT